MNFGEIDNLRDIDLAKMDETGAFTRKHFVALADSIRQAIRSARALDDTGSAVKALEKLANDFADMFAASNSRFDRKRFLDACGIPTGRSEEEGIPTKREGPSGRGDDWPSTLMRKKDEYPEG